jgi:hypothetical protein
VSVATEVVEDGMLVLQAAESGRQCGSSDFTVG